jgi:hypothetical protein
MPQDNVFSLKPRPRLEEAHQTVRRQIQMTNHAARRLPYLSDLAITDEINSRDNAGDGAFGALLHAPLNAGHFDAPLFHSEQPSQLRTAHFN